MIECIHVKNIKTKITVNVNIFRIVLVKSILILGGFFLFSLSKMYNLDVKTENLIP